MARDIVTQPSAYKLMRCVVYFLDNSETTFECNKKDKGQTLFEKALKHVELHEGDYFGLQFVDVNANDDVNEPQTVASHLRNEDLRWLDSAKQLKKQLKVGPPYVLFFRVKFYVPDPSILREEFTRYQFFQQLAKDMAEGKLVAPYKTAILLASLAVQSELGDYNAEEHKDTYLNEFTFLPGQTSDFLLEVAAMHKKHRGLSPATCEKIFIDTAKNLDSYGLQPFSATWDQSNDEVQLGVMAHGIVVFQHHLKVNTFMWSKINKVSFKRKQFFIHQRKESSDSVENVYGFNMASYRSCKNLWKSCVEYHKFFCSRARCTVLVYDGPRHDFSGTPSCRLYGRQIGSNGLNNDVVVASRLGGIQSNHSCESPVAPVYSDVAAVGKAISVARISPQSNLTHLDETDARVGDLTNCSLGPHVKLCTSSAISVDSTNSTPVVQLSPDVNCRSIQLTASNGVVCPSVSKSECHQSLNGNRVVSDMRPVNLTSHLTVAVNQTESCLTESHITQRCDGSRSMMMEKPVQNVATSLQRCHVNSLANQSSSASSSFDNVSGGPVNSDHRLGAVSSIPNGTVVPFDVTAVLSAADRMTASLDADGIMAVSDPCISCTDSDKSPTEVSYELPVDPAVVEFPVHDNIYNNVVTIRIKPDENGRFGFNVKGGSDQMMPVIVSRVVPNSPADLCMPRLNEGDQVLFVNARDISQHTHAQVVQFIRASCELHSGELVLGVKQNVYLGDEDTPSEPDFQYIPDTPSVSMQDGDPLSASMTALREGLENGSVLTQFEQLYRKKPNMTMDISQLQENLSKNRYRDISPYDQTRVKLKGLSHDYINANYVNMDIPGSGIINRYIAAQGPLPETSGDFWQMVWDQRSSLIVMLTTNMERGRVKCHQYWPSFNRSTKFGKLSVCCRTESTSSLSFVFRDFTLTHADDDDDKRHVYQMQYLSWPDHGVPDDCSDFLDFVTHVRLNRSGVVEPTIVHCSAGIGRTGVLIAMETAMCLIEANQPISMPDIVKQMRDQRAMLIQTVGQYKFVCEAVLKVFYDHIVEPLEEFKR